jgi:hypothetical protein
MKAALVLAALAALALAGCGSGSRLSARQLRLQANAICSQANRRTARIPPPRSTAGTAQFLNRGIRVFTPELVKLRHLDPPNDDVADVYRTSVQAFSQKLSALKRTVRELDQGVSPVTAMTELARRLTPIESSEDAAWRALEVSACLNR